jgi:predicted PurR-regulated permease PerM
MGSKLVNLGLSVPNISARLFIFLAIVGGLLPNYRRFVETLLALSPLDDEVDRLYLRRIKAMTWSMFVGIAVIALIQGLVTGFFFWITGVPYAALWTLIAIVTSTLPLGSSLVALPVAVAQMITGNLTGGLIVFGGYIVVVTNLDNLIRPRLVSREAYLDAALVLVAALGGYDLFGFFGVIYGPVLMILAVTTLEVYRTYYAPRQKVGAVEIAARTSAPLPPLPKD